MLTFFTTAKSFEGHSGIIQRNALQSWKLLHPDVEVILFGDELGAGETCGELGLRHEPYVERHESGLKRLDYMFARAQQISRHDCLCYSNCDIIFFQDFRKALSNTGRWTKKFLLLGQRCDTDIAEPVDFGRSDWGNTVRDLALANGRRQIPDFIDYFGFSKGLYDEVPPLVVGRSFWDWWFVWKALSTGTPVVDCTACVMAVHQNHGHSYHPEGKQGTNEDAMALYNLAVAGGRKHLRYIVHSTHRLDYRGRFRRTPFWVPPLYGAGRALQNIYWPVKNSLIYKIWQPCWHFCLDWTRPARARLGLRSKMNREIHKASS